jgi:hypothetical protein
VRRTGTLGHGRCLQITMGLRRSSIRDPSISRASSVIAAEVPSHYLWECPGWSLELRWQDIQ